MNNNNSRLKLISNPFDTIKNQNEREQENKLMPKYTLAKSNILVFQKWVSVRAAMNSNKVEGLDNDTIVLDNRSIK